MIEYMVQHAFIMALWKLLSKHELCSEKAASAGGQIETISPGTMLISAGERLLWFALKGHTLDLEKAREVTRSQTALLQVETLTEQMGRNQKGTVSHQFHKLREPFLPLTEEAEAPHSRIKSRVRREDCASQMAHALSQ